MKLKATLTLSVVSCLLISPLRAEGNFLEKAYLNDKGSRLEFNIDKQTGKLTGRYISALGCAKGTPAPLTGWRNQKAISFTVHFGECGSITSWVGHVEADKSIKTIWTLSRGDSSDWNTLLTGASTFTPISKGKRN